MFRVLDLACGAGHGSRSAPKIVAQATLGTVPEPPIASLRRRFGALLLDWLLCLLIAGFFGPVRASVWPSVILTLEYAFFVGLFGQTVGMRVAGIRCAPVGGGPGVIGVPRAALRGLLLCMVVPALVMDAQRRGWHDRAAGSVMVQAQAQATP
jgi:uncharacterized RDD family membrane protein YckC